MLYIGAAAPRPSIRCPRRAGSSRLGLKAKVAAGAQFVQTQFCMDTAIVRRYTARLAEAGLAVHLLVGVNPLRSAKSAAWMRRHLFGTIIPDAMVARLEEARDPAAEGRDICVETIAELSCIPGVAGVHIMAPGNDAAVPEVIAAARRAVYRGREGRSAGAFEGQMRPEIGHRSRDQDHRRARHRERDDLLPHGRQRAEILNAGAHGPSRLAPRLHSIASLGRRGSSCAACAARGETIPLRD